MVARSSRPNQHKGQSQLLLKRVNKSNQIPILKYMALPIPVLSSKIMTISKRDAQLTK